MTIAVDWDVKLQTKQTNLFPYVEQLSVHFILSSSNYVLSYLYKNITGKIWDHEGMYR